MPHGFRGLLQPFRRHEGVGDAGGAGCDGNDLLAYGLGVLKNGGGIGQNLVHGGADGLAHDSTIRHGGAFAHQYGDARVLGLRGAELVQHAFGGAYFHFNTFALGTGRVAQRLRGQHPGDCCPPGGNRCDDVAHLKTPVFFIGRFEVGHRRRALRSAHEAAGLARQG